MQNLLVTGAGGFLGYNVVCQAAASFHVSAQYRNNVPVFGDDIKTYATDLSDEKALETLLNACNPQFIIHCAAASHPNFCEENPHDSFNANILANVLLAKHCALRGIKLVFTSTDLVFDGNKGGYSEDDFRNPIMIYGKHKALAEDIFRDHLPSAAICRMPLMFGEAPSGAASFIQGFNAKLKAGEKLNLFYDEYRSTMHADDAAQGLLWAAAHVSGIIHLCGKEKLSRYEFGEVLCEVMGYDKKLLHAVSNKSVTMAAPRASDASMNGTMAYASGFNPLPVRERLLQMKSANQL
ncbi:sugar nucleotide-binding protein [bacterium]|nr:sugar nucleotide-binding protein [bacterium]